MARRGRHREKLLEDGLRLFARHGFAATGVQEITAAVGIPKGSFYNYFESKEAFARAVLAHYQREACAGLEELLSRPAASPLARLRGTFEELADRLEKGGFAVTCLAARLAQELAAESPPMRAPVDGVLACMESLIARVLVEARAAGELEAEADPQALAEYLHNAWQGAVVRAKAVHGDRPLRRFVDVTFERLLRPTPGAGSAPRRT